jgi:phage shock protein PspC (stress-responsive transcriptional regulator)
MSIAEEVRKLAELRDSGALTSEEFERAKARLLGGSQPQNGPAGPAPGSERSTGGVQTILRRARRDRWVGGVCGGLGVYTGVESWIWRVLFTAGVLFAGFGFLPYIILWIFVPADDSI